MYQLRDKESERESMHVPAEYILRVQCQRAESACTSLHESAGTTFVQTTVYGQLTLLEFALQAANGQCLS